MAKKPVDRRIRYTQMVLKESFIHLLETKDISKITIKEICEDADINRATFYAHYQDQYDLMKKIQDELFENVSKHLDCYNQTDLNVVPVAMIEPIFIYIKDNAKLCKLLLSDRGDINFQKKILSLVYEKNIHNLIQNTSLTQLEAEYIYAFTLTGCIGAIQKWLENDMDQSPRVMAELIVTMATQIPRLWQ